MGINLVTFIKESIPIVVVVMFTIITTTVVIIMQLIIDFPTSIKSYVKHFHFQLLNLLEFLSLT